MFRIRPKTLYSTYFQISISISDKEYEKFLLQDFKDILGNSVTYFIRIEKHENESIHVPLLS